MKMEAFSFLQVTVLHSPVDNDFKDILENIEYALLNQLTLTTFNSIHFSSSRTHEYMIDATCHGNINWKHVKSDLGNFIDFWDL